MRFALIFTAFFVVLSSNASSLGVTKAAVSNAYLSGGTSRSILMVKPLSTENFLKDYGALGSLYPSGIERTYYFKLNRIPKANHALNILEIMNTDLNLEYAYFVPYARNSSLKLKKLIKKALVTGVTPDFENAQNYLKPAPKGIGAKEAWNLAGGAGQNVKIIDIETCWNESHEDFTQVFYRGQNPKCDANSQEHGTAVWGEIAAKQNGKGITGIAHQAQFGIYGFSEGVLEDVNDQYINSVNAAIQGATAQLSAGDILIIEQEMNGPDENKGVAIEYWPHIFEMLKAATDKGIICVAAAGNGNSNFDSDVYQGAFDLQKRDSGCIIVGAGDSKRRNRLSFSNYGSRIDAMGFGSNVVTTGYGDLFQGGLRNSTQDYTSQFNGTSSATPIVAGAIAILSSVAKEQGRVLTPQEVRYALRNSGTPQGQLTQNERIGSLPNIFQALSLLGLNTY